MTKQLGGNQIVLVLVHREMPDILLLNHRNKIVAGKLGSSQGPSESNVLRNYLTDDADGLFPPVFYFYCSGLLDLGSLNEVRRLVRESGKDESDPMIRDLKGKMQERSGLWKDAYEIYHNSRWPVHRYRAGICGLCRDSRSTRPRTDSGDEGMAGCKNRGEGAPPAAIFVPGSI
jgi:hypothetical protein